MLSFSFSRISFTKAAKYVFLITTHQETKRTDVCFSLTSSPTFDQSIDFQESQLNDTYKIKACEATIDRKLKIVGISIVESREFLNFQNEQSDEQILIFDRDLQLVQTVEGKNIPVGRCHLQVRRKPIIEKLHVSKVDNKSLQYGKKQPEEIKPLQASNVKSLQLSGVYPKNNQLSKSQLYPSKSPQENIYSQSHAVQPTKFKQSQVIDTKTISSGKKIPQQKNISSIMKQQIEDDFDSDLQFQEIQQPQIQPTSSIRFFIHGGTNFYLGSEFSVQLRWGDKYCQTNYIRDKIQPQWAQSLTLVGDEDQLVVMNIIDDKKNILQSTKFSLKNIRKLYPYHLRLVFREQYMGDRPVVYFSMVREDLPRFTILDKQIQLVISCDDDNVRNPLKYLIVQAKSQLQVPRFYEIDLGRYSSFQQVNKIIENLEVGDYNWNLFVPLETGKRGVTMFKSQLNKQLSLFLVTVNNWLQAFNPQLHPKRPLSSNCSTISIIETRPNFQLILKQIYYHQQIHRVGKSTQIYSESSLRQGQINDQNQWRMMTKNYVLRNQLFNTSVRNVAMLKKRVSEKGEQLVKLKKILKEVKYVNTTLKEKQKSALSSTLPRSRSKQRLNVDSIKITDIELMLYEKQAQLEFKKRRNQEMSQRMQSLNVMEGDTTELDLSITKNAKLLLQQQQKIKLLMLMRRQLPKQRDLIAKLQKIFEKQELDREMNELLKAEQERLNEIRIKKKQDLKNVYDLLKEKNKQQDTLQAKIERAEQELIRLNQAYAKLTGL